MEAVPREFGDFFVPFLGEGAAAIAVVSAHPGHTTMLGSTDTELLNVWQALAADVDEVVRGVHRHIAEHSEHHFAEVRGEQSLAATTRPTGPTSSGSAAERAARVLYLAGSSRVDTLPASFDSFAEARYGRDSVAFDEGNLRALALLLRTSSVRFDSRPFFALLPEIREDDLVWLEPPAGILNHRPRDVSSFIAAVTAKGAFLLAPAPAPDAPQNSYDTLPSMTVVDDQPGGEVIWGNRLLARART